MTARHLRAPSTDGALLAEPPLHMAGGQAAANAARLSAWDYDFQGRRASWLRPQIRREILELARGFLPTLRPGSKAPRLPAEPRRP